MKKFVLLFIFLFVAACTKVEFGYKLAPRSMMSKLDDSFDFNSDRFKQIKSQMEQDFAANKAHAAQLALKHIEEITVLSSTPNLTPTDFKAFYASLQISRSKLIDLFKPSFAVVINELSGDEVESLVEFSAKKFKDADKKLKRKDVFFDKQIDTFEKVMDFFFDDANKDQIQIYQTFIEENYSYFVAQAEARKEFIAKFQSLSQNKAELLPFVLKYYTGDLSAKSAEHQVRHEQFMEQLYKVQAKIWIASTAKQKENLHKNLVELKKQIEPLSKN